MPVIFILFLCAVALLMSWQSRNKEKNIRVSTPSVPQPKPRPTRKPHTVRKTFAVSNPSVPHPRPRPTRKPLPVEKRFVQVAFNERSQKRYDYLLGNIYDLEVGDFVLVPIRKSKERLDKEFQRLAIEMEITSRRGEKPRKTTCLRARVKYISEPGETSEYARSKIKRKTDRRKW